MNTSQDVTEKVAPPPRAHADDPYLAANRPRPDGIRDTIESIVVAFILAFVFRAFMVEAFVIPTGSMAPGLRGQHAIHRCSVCSYSFDFGIREDIRLAMGRVQEGTLAHAFNVECPNCGYEEGGNSALNQPENRITSNAGDRILVLKWPYDIGGDLLGPKRWDVVVFKDPEDGETNFIKRLIGLPGEVLQILDGDIYATPIKDVPEDIRDALSKPPALNTPDARRLTPAQFETLATRLQIQRKTRIAQESLWMLHYDHDFVPDPGVPASPTFTPPRWESEQNGSGWDATTPRVKFAPNSPGEKWLRLVGKPVQDGYGYNNVSIHRSPQAPKLVGDVMLRCVLVPMSQKGHVSFHLSKGSDAFVAQLHADGRAFLYRIGHGGVSLDLDKKQLPAMAPGKALQIEVENLDYRIALRIDGEEVLATSDAHYAPNPLELVQYYGRDDARNEARLRIGAEDLALEIRHLAVLRDVYYRADCTLEDRSQFNRPNPMANLAGWGTTLNPILLRDDPQDFYCLGDNSPQSKDSRLWWQVCPMLQDRGDYHFGTVPGDQMIGRAFFVYWPSGFRLSKETPAIIPNVGRMRMIR